MRAPLLAAGTAAACALGGCAAGAGAADAAVLVIPPRGQPGSAADRRWKIRPIPRPETRIERDGAAPRE